MYGGSPAQAPGPCLFPRWGQASEARNPRFRSSALTSRTTMQCIKSAVMVGAWLATKAALQAMARRQHRSVAELRDEAVSQWLDQQAENDDGEAVQQQLRHAASSTFGRITGGDANRAQEASARVHEKLLSRLAQ